MKMRAEIEIREVNGEEVKSGTHNLQTLFVESHRIWNASYGGLVVLKFGDTSITVTAQQLEEACKRCTGLK